MTKSKRVSLEESVLSALLLCEFKEARLIGLEPSDFTGKRKAIFSAGCELVDQFGVADVASISCRVGDPCYVSSLLELEVSSRNLQIYASELKKLLLAEAIAAAKHRAADRLRAGEDIAIVSRDCVMAMDMAASRYGEQGENELVAASDAIMARIESGEPSGALTFGLGPIDRLTGGLVGGESVVLAGRPSAGKTALAIQLLRMLAEKDTRSLFISLEMTPSMVAGRLLAQIAGIDSRDLIRSPEKADGDKRSHALEHRDKLRAVASKMMCHFSGSVGMETIRTVARRAAQSGAKILCLDYIQLMEGNQAYNRNLQIEQISRQWRCLLKELGVPGILLSQLSRSCEQENRYPNLSDLRDSGSIEQDADVVWLLTPPMGKNNGLPKDCTLIIQAKGRDHGTGVAKLKFVRETQTFREYGG